MRRFLSGISRLPAPTGQKHSAWERIENYIKEERLIQPIRKLVVKGSIDVVFRRCSESNESTLIVAGETADAVASVRTCYTGGKLVIEREGGVIGGLNGMVFHSSVGQFISIGRGGVTISPALAREKVVVGVSLPEAPIIKIKGSGSALLLDLQQAELELEVQGSGSITAYGQVAHLEVEIAGSGDVDASELIADRASLSVAGSGDIEAFIRSEVCARVAGSGGILVRGNPLRRDHSVAGSGKIKFR